MYTQCQNCKAIFRVNMREVTVAKGKLRCGECLKVFNATESLSTTIPKPFVEKNSVETNPQSSPKKRTLSPPPKLTVKGVERKWYEKKPKQKKKPKSKKIKQVVKPKIKSKLALRFVLGLLSLLLITQILYQNRHFFTGEPQHQPEKIQMLNHNIFTHPNEPNVLLISASMENTAKKPQPYPILEVTLSNAQSQVLALRRFKPTEYLDEYSPKQLLAVKKATSIKLKIKDPGRNATRFQFNFY